MHCGRTFCPAGAYEEVCSTCDVQGSLFPDSGDDCISAAVTDEKKMRNG